MNQIEKDINSKNPIKNPENESKEIKMQESTQDINNLDNIFKEKNKVNIILFLISEFGFIFILGFILLLLYIIPQYHPSKVFTSKTQNQGFDSTYTPKIFIHTTDIHITLNKQKE